MEHQPLIPVDLGLAEQIKRGDAMIVAVIPCHNRDRVIGSLLIKLQHYVDRMIVVNDGSTDQTGAVARQAGADVIEHVAREGAGVAVEHGLAAALGLGADVVVLLEGDAQMFPEQVPLVLEPVLHGDADMAAGVAVSHARRKITVGPLARQRLAIEAHGTSDGLRVFNRVALAACGLMPAAPGVKPTAEVVKQQLRALEIPLSQLDAPKPARSRAAVRRDLVVRLVGVTGPARTLLLLAILGVFLTTLGIYFWYQTVQIFDARNQLALGHALLGTLSITVGIMIAFEALTLHVIRRLVQPSGPGAANKQ